MKAQIDSSRNGGGGVREGKVHKSRNHQHNSHREEDNAEIKAYLNKLQQLVPFMPKNRKLSKLEVITHVIDYIRDLRQTLGLPPCIGNNDFDMESASAIMMTAQQPQVNSAAITLDVINNNNSNSSPVAPVPNTSSPHHHHHQSHHHHQRQPLCVISNPNGNTNSCGSHEIPQLMDKSPSADVDTRPVSC